MNVSAHTLHSTLTSRAHHVRLAGEEDAIAGVTPQVVVEATDEDEVAAVLRFASEQGLAVLVRGGGTQLAVGMPPDSGDILLSTVRLRSIIEHAPHDQTVSVQAGLALGELQAALGRTRQWLALDPLVPATSTLGGIIATNASGAHRLRYGGVRDQLIGIRVALADGTLARGGGKVVKNVAGYDLPKLFTGALGTLGVVVSATFRLYPLLPESRTVVVRASSPAPLGELALQTINSTLVPTVIDLLGPGVGGEAADMGTGRDCALVVRFESGVAAAVTDQAEALLARASGAAGSAGSARTLDGEDERAFWRHVDAVLTTADAHDGSVLLKASLLPADVAPWLEQLDAQAHVAGVTASWRAHAGHGLIYVRLAGADAGADGGAALAELVAGLRQSAEGQRGSMVVLDGPPALLRTLDVWGSVPALDVMHRIKERFDPGGILNPGRFVGGI
jgi:glycolate oxidase FAD binding subunit